MNEIWKPIKNFPGYEVSNLGYVRSFKKRVGAEWHIMEEPQRILRPTLQAGYRAVILCHQSKSTLYRIARLVLAAFVGPRPKGMETCHADCNRENDHLSNLRYDTRSENLRDGCGSHVKRRLTNKQAYEARQFAAQGITDAELSTRFEVSIQSIYNCRLGNTHTKAGGPITRHDYKLTDEQVRQIRKTASISNIMLFDLAQEYGVSESCISLIIRGKRRKAAGGPLKIDIQKSKIKS